MISEKTQEIYIVKFYSLSFDKHPGMKELEKNNFKKCVRR